MCTNSKPEEVSIAKDEVFRGNMTLISQTDARLTKPRRRHWNRNSILEAGTDSNSLLKEPSIAIGSDFIHDGKSMR